MLSSRWWNATVATAVAAAAAAVAVVVVAVVVVVVVVSVVVVVEEEEKEPRTARSPCPALPPFFGLEDYETVEDMGDSCKPYIYRPGSV